MWLLACVFLQQVFPSHRGADLKSVGAGSCYSGSATEERERKKKLEVCEQLLWYSVALDFWKPVMIFRRCLFNVQEVAATESVLGPPPTCMVHHHLWQLSSKLICVGDL